MSEGKLTSKEIVRYSRTYDDMKPNSLGQWVRHEDFAALRESHQRLQQDVARYENGRVVLMGELERLQRERDSWKALAEIRKRCLDACSSDEPTAASSTMDRFSDQEFATILCGHLVSTPGITETDREFLDQAYRRLKARPAEPAATDLTFLLFHILDELGMYEDFTRNEIADHLRAELKRRGIERPSSTKGAIQ